MVQRKSAAGDFGWSLAGTCAGVLIAALAVHFYLPHFQPKSPRELQPDLTSVLIRDVIDDRPDIVFFAAFYLSGFIGSLAAIQLGRRGSAGPGLPLCLVAVFAPLASQCVRRAFLGDAFWPWFFAAALPLLIAALSLVPHLGRSLLGSRFPRCAATRADHPRAPGPRRGGDAPPSAAGDWDANRGVFLDLFVWALLALTAFPSSLGAVGVKILSNPHPASYAVGVATYFYKSGIVPGRDFFLQYGLGPPAVFRFLLSDDPLVTMDRFVVFGAAGTWLFFGAFYELLKRVFRSRAWAAPTALLSLILVFHHLWRAAGFYFDLSGWPLRFLFLPLTVWLIVVACTSNRSPAVRWFAVGLSAGLAVFWNTETGIYSILVATACVAFSTPPRRWALPSLSLACGTVASFLLCSTLALGRQAWDVDFLSGLVEPLFIYGGGMSAWRVDWNKPGGLLYNIVSPLLLIGSVGYSVVRFPGARHPEARQTLSFLLSVSLFGLLLSLKYVNRSFNSLWFANSAPFVAVFAFWLRELTRSGLPDCGRSPSFLPALGRSLRHGFVAGAWIVLFGYTWWAGAQGAFWGVGLSSWLKFPSVAKWALTLKRPEGWPAGLKVISDAEVALLRESTRPDERVALLSLRDWMFLAAAGRASSFFYTPSPFLPRISEIDPSLRGARRIFIDTAAPGENAELNERLQKLLASDFIQEGRVDRLLVYRRKDLRNRERVE